MAVSANLEENLLVAKSQVALCRDADIVVLPEMFVCPYDTTCFPKYAQKQGEEVWQALSQMARENQVYLVGGSVPERDDGVYNTAYVFDPQGNQIAKHRKVHLFDIDVPGGQYFKESDTLTGGNHITTFDTPFGKMGLVICFDIRFPKMFAQMEADVVFVPAAFNPTTGPAHWELLFRSRAVDYQCFTVGVSGSPVPGGYQAYGHSIVVDPWGTVVCQLNQQPGTRIVELDLEKIPSVRRQIPLSIGQK